MEEERTILIQIVSPFRNTFLVLTKDRRFEIGIVTYAPTPVNTEEKA